MAGSQDLGSRGLITILFLLCLTCPVTDVNAQAGEKPLRIFGYFQNTFQHQTESQDRFIDGVFVDNWDNSENSFTAQQLNLFFQKDIDPKWRAFVNFEFLNNFSSSRQQGNASLEEAWIRYRANSTFNLKLGLLLPTFNNLNEIKNRTPLLPYIIRPLIYETAFREFIAVEDYTPQRAFVQAYGFLPAGTLNLDYAAYLGNSPNVRTLEQEGQSGTDSTDTFLVGARLGIRYGELKTGVSVTRENDNQLDGAFDNPDLRQLAFLTSGRDPGNASASRFREVPRTRLGFDLSYYWHGLSVEAETVSFKVQNESELDIERSFYYATIGYEVTDEIFIYGSYWKTDDKTELFDLDLATADFKIPTVGFSYRVNDRILLKAQYASGDLEGTEVRVNAAGTEAALFRATNKFNFFATAVSVRF